MQLSREEIRAVWTADRLRERRRFRMALLITLGVFLLSLCVRYHAYFYDKTFLPVEYGKSLLLALRLLASRLLGTELYRQQEALIEAAGTVVYYGALARLRETAVAFVAGAALSMAGAIFQSAYRNPMASPNIIGATAGVDLGNVLSVMLYSGAVAENLFLRYRFCYGFSALCVLLVFLLGKLANLRQETGSVLEIVMAGSVVSQGIRVGAMYLMYQLEDEDLLLYERFRLGTYFETDAVSTAIFFAVMAVSILPVLALRYRLNAMGLGQAEGMSMGAGTGSLRILGQVCGAVMTTCAVIHCGDAGMVALVIPWAVEKLRGAEFRDWCLYSALGGGTLLMVCGILRSFLYILDEPVPMALLTDMILIPLFLLILVVYRRRKA